MANLDLTHLARRYICIKNIMFAPLTNELSYLIPRLVLLLGPEASPPPLPLLSLSTFCLALY